MTAPSLSKIKALAVATVPLIISRLLVGPWAVPTERAQLRILLRSLTPQEKEIIGNVLARKSSVHKLAFDNLCDSLVPKRGIE